jgi:hypothetical protein
MDFTCNISEESGFLEEKLYEFSLPILNFDNYGNAIVEYKIEKFTTSIFYDNLEN